MLLEPVNLKPPLEDPVFGCPEMGGPQTPSEGAEVAGPPVQPTRHRREAPPQSSQDLDTCLGSPPIYKPMKKGHEWKG